MSSRGSTPTCVVSRGIISYNIIHAMVCFCDYHSDFVRHDEFHREISLGKADQKSVVFYRDLRRDFLWPWFGDLGFKWFYHFAGFTNTFASYLGLYFDFVPHPLLRSFIYRGNFARRAFISIYYNLCTYFFSRFFARNN